LSEILNIKIRNPRSPLPAPRSPLHARTIAIPKGNVLELGEAGEGIFKVVGVAGVLVLPWQVGMARILPIVVLLQLDVVYHHDVEVLETAGLHHEDRLDQLVNPLALEEKCAICNWPKNDYGHIQLIYDSTTKKLH
jgi:hypothetical protein